MIGYKVSKTNFFDRDAIIRAMSKGSRQALSKAGGLIRKIARRSIRRVKDPDKASAAGTPPNTHNGFLREDIFYAYDQLSSGVVIGPSRQPWLNRLHEFGGELVLKEFQNVETGFVALFRKGPKSRRRWKTTGRTVSKTYPARPFMAPALDKARPSLPSMWRSSLKSAA